MGKSLFETIMEIVSWVELLLVVLPTVVGLFTPLEDPKALDKYYISYVTPEHWENAIENNATALSEGSFLHLGNDLSCYIPQLPPDWADSNKEDDEFEFHRLLEDNLQRGVEIIINSSEKCATFVSGFWTYEYCPNSQLSQFHGNPKKTPLHYVLARSQNIDEDRKFQLLYNNFHYYISEIVGSGDVCDLTGNPRVVEIQYVCAAAADAATIQWIKEVKTCYYEVQIAVPKLCELELLSSNQDKKKSNPLICVNQGKETTSIVNLMGKYEPIFVGSDFYLLKPHANTTIDPRNILLYSGKHKIKDKFVQSDAELYENIGSAFSRMLFQQLLISSSERPFKPGDEFSWVSDVVDLQGNFLTRLQFNLSSSSLADITLDSTVQLPENGNLVYHRSHDVDESKKMKESKALSQLQRIKNSKGLEKDIKLVIMDESHNVVQFLDVSEADDLFEEVLTAEQLSAIFDESNENAVDRSSFEAQLEHESLANSDKDIEELQPQVHTFEGKDTSDLHSEIKGESNEKDKSSSEEGEGKKEQLMEAQNGGSENKYIDFETQLHDEL